MNRVILERPYWLLPLLVWTVVVLTSFWWNWRELNSHAGQLAENRAQFVFKMVESVRLWNARHGGVYAATDENTRPNPYLEVPERDILTPAGTQLTLINPAFMTRQLTEVVRELSGMTLHITSLKPLNPLNAPDPWEQTALESFEQGVPERGEFVGSGKGAIYRYMAPLVTMEACLECHRKQGYRVGDIRGGISVSFPAMPLLSSTAGQVRNIVLLHLAVWLLLTSLTLYALSRFRSQMLSLKQAKEEQDALVVLRTAELREQVRERGQAEARLRLVIESSGEGIYCVDEAGRCTLINARALELFGFRSAAEVVGREIHGLVHHGEDEGAECPLRATYREGSVVYSEDDYFLRRNGEPFPVEYRSYPLREGTRVIGAVVTFADITERREMQQQIWHQANFDTLTGLVNRALFMDRLEQALARAQRDGRGVALMFLDLDGFKGVNDTLGHAAGDELLRQAGQRLLQSVRSSDTVARMGGDEFTVLVSDLDGEADVAALAEKLRERLALPFDLQGGEARVSASIGVAIYPRHGRSAAELLKQADAAMYVAKRHGRNACRVGAESDAAV